MALFRESDMKGLFAGAALLVMAQIAAASAQDSCRDPWERLPGTYKCEGSCNYTATVCALPEYAEGIKRWRFATGKATSVTGVLVEAGGKNISFATSPGWDFKTASTSDCAATIKFVADSGEVQWKRIDSSAPACGSSRRQR
jgi:hypothetical protein